jgi:hypothetical protein
MQLDPAAQVAEQGPLSQTNAHVLSGPHAHEPFAHTPLHSGLLPSHVT